MLFGFFYCESILILLLTTSTSDDTMSGDVTAMVRLCCHERYRYKNEHGDVAETLLLENMAFAVGKLALLVNVHDPAWLGRAIKDL